ncbi:lysophospholipid acyltransferase family protein [Leeuwenhoekiella marinoflava]|uniref:KDO2-lipid IV(A) lauroyltransferase n=2 Tax=Leeuwenhoekiella marinoflava TaxID=988 RepID=A0A4Q0PPG0_9FLAO|nr:lipid A biosynthesis acyltransferase [Leeuwenhoekiella marinoflava]RXG32460.1 KDO2-lipid IV(A) lauroyltransferase [Leeuwenhoekiella marinoflava]SHE70887.1 KDO2-lipid IV(A) lauroyltransferase [Leeuwenhoekiella marinoflava DSM 3653]
MQWLIFWLVYPLLWMISRLPFWLFYKVSDAVFVLAYHIVGYRRKTVTKNLKLAFPEKEETEIKKIEKQFYRHMCDMFLEMIKSISISAEELQKRFQFDDLTIIEKLAKEQRSSLIIMGHYASYEWLTALQFYFDHTGYGIYKRIKNKYFDKLIHDIREKWNSKLLANKEATFIIRKQQRTGKMATYAFIADQSPKTRRNQYCTDFLGQNVPFFTGVERLAKSENMPVLYLAVDKVKRGFYKASFKVITEEPNTVPDFEITDAFAEHLENQIYKAPQYYLWTHKRFKHAR